MSIHLKFAIVLFLTISATYSVVGQQFTHEDIGKIVAVRADSRSVNFLDINNDGWEDIFISNGLEGGQNDLIYVNDGRGRFTSPAMDVASDNLSSVGASFADANNDGYMDAFVTNWYGQRDGLFFNDGNGLLNLVSDNLVRKMSFAESAAWGDFNNDGFLDLYVTTSGGAKKNFLFKNLGEGNFEQIIEGPLVTEQDASRSVNWIDANGDGLLDLFVGNEDNTSNDLYYNRGDGAFEGINIGLATTFSSSWGDVDNDGDFDLFLANTNITNSKSNQLLMNDNGDFNQIATGTAHKDGGCSNGSSFGDYDNDGDLDLIVTNGFCLKRSNYLYENLGDGTMVRADDELPGLRDVCSYGVAWGDINNDGFIDLMIANCKNDRNDLEPTNDLYINNGNENHWLKIKLEGTQSNRNAIGAIVKAKASFRDRSTWQHRQVSSQSGYSGQNSLWVHFGLSDATTVDSLVIIWPSGGQMVLTNVEVDQHLQILEGMSTSTLASSKANDFGMTVWPNPINAIQQSLTVVLDYPTSSFSSMTKVELIDSVGRHISNFQNKGSANDGTQTVELTIDEVHLSPGMYMIRASSGNQIFVQKVMVFK